jgi:FAD/FMN-containing dehydrogenase
MDGDRRRGGPEHELRGRAFEADLRSHPWPAMDETIVRELAAVVGEGHVLTDASLLGGYEHDTSGRFHGRAAAVVRPANTSEVAGTLRICNAHGIPVVAQGGNTGLVGGGVPRGGELVVSLARLRRLEPVDRVAGRVVAGAGVTLEELQRHASEYGLAVAIDFAARAGATLGGMVATDAGGQLALRHGTMRAQVAGLEAVLIDGSVLARLSGLEKDNAGYDLSQLIIGSEGTLALVTAVSVRLIPRARHRVSVLFGLDSLELALALLERLRVEVGSLEAADFFEEEGLRLVRAYRSLPEPLGREHPAYLIVDCAGEGDPLPALERTVEDAGLAHEVAAAESTAERAALWSYRELHNEALARIGVAHKLDVSVPVAEVPRFAREVRARIGTLEPQARVIMFGHLGDGNVHVNVLRGSGLPDDRLETAVLGLVAERGGSISAEHGVGVAKVDHLALVRTPDEIEAMRRIKLALDPGWLLNPGCVLPAPRSTRAGC